MCPNLLAGANNRRIDWFGFNTLNVNLTAAAGFEAQSATSYSDVHSGTLVSEREVLMQHCVQISCGDYKAIAAMNPPDVVCMRNESV